MSSEWSPVSATVLHCGGDILVFSALTWVVAHAVDAPGRITFHRLQGASVLYLNFAMIFASAYEDEGLSAALAANCPLPKHVLLDADSVNSIDTSACDALLSFIKKLQSPSPSPSPGCTIKCESVCEIQA